jgi:hypothetical protein
MGNPKELATRRRRTKQKQNTICLDTTMRKQTQNTNDVPTNSMCTSGNETVMD